MSSPSAAETIAETRNIFVESCMNGVIITLLLYDYVLTLGSEIDLFWRRAPVLARLIFFSLRLSILGAVITTIADSYVPKYDEFLKPCIATYFSYVVLWFVGSFVIAIVTTARAYAVTGGRWLWTSITFSLSMAGIILNAYYQAKMQFRLVELNSAWTCWEAAELPPSFNMIVTLMMIVCNTLADAVVIIATWIRTFALVRFHGRRNQQRRSIAWLLLRDGTIYFGALFSVNLAFTIIGALSDKLSYLSSLNSPLQLILTSRLLINLRELSVEDIHIGPRQVSDEVIVLSSTVSELSTLSFTDSRGRAASHLDGEVSIETRS
ncbi:hypothetical protein C8Q72DRAFT_830133 [Fomitopsis betulina]|nr:hypothetical protein C8Q72DRAFT_830133 [Fomitopsis betulina]